ncbi:Response regulator receiver domain-containing protein [Maridesulfovibrio ferrireducens]|uniref:Response regulator receiver domain-containing protein n=1 Tax=Maridesulfovibrio ferrireducens TaxID=246191 RepID=A0A1G9L870_9BACT|nr:response regulator [Maridesulfovibrio ferrireducens]SDL57933.1 Response regulator receiver domain-containing protein [Maridesulfovibrio ferrireducens]
MSRIRVLVVDDEPDFLKLIGRRLAKRNVDVDVANNGQEALNFLSKTSVNVVILDVRMPGLSGIETLKEIRRRYHDVEVIMLTGHGSVQSGIEGISHGAYDYILKPFLIDDLLERIRAANEHSELKRQSRSVS